MRLWAFATSPDGLRLTPARLWSLSWPEYNALQRVHIEHREAESQRFATLLAHVMNAPHFTRTDKQMWEPLDFMPDSPRKRALEAERSERRIQKAMDDLAVQRLNMQLGMMRPGVVPEGLDPIWTRPYSGKAN